MDTGLVLSAMALFSFVALLAAWVALPQAGVREAASERASHIIPAERVGAS